MGRIVFLGTGDSLNDERAQTSLALPLDSEETLLIDTSSGSVLLRQLRAARFGLASIRHVFISHRHFDHTGGLAPLLVALASIPSARLTIYAPHDTLRALHALLTLTIPGVEDWLEGRLRWHELAAGVAVQAGSVTVTPFAVAHGLECMGFRLEQGGATAVFSADTRPSPRVVTYATGADLLIHEAYSLDTGAAEAHAFGHATASGAGNVARAAGARRLLLTHVRASPFIDSAELVDEAGAAFGQPVMLARDLDTIDY